MGKIQNDNIKKKKINIKLNIIIVIIILVAIFFCLYNFNYQFRKNVNNIITLKANTSDGVPMINIDQNSMNAIFGYSEYFAILKQNTITGYVGQQ